MKYFIHHSGDQKGPWSFEQLVRSLEVREVSWTDYVYDDSTKDWVMLMEFQPLAQHMKTSLSVEASSEEKSSVVSTSAPAARELKGDVEGSNLLSLTSKNPSEHEWYVLRDEDKFGPFKYLELIRLLQEKKLFEYEFVWFKGMSTWQKVSELAEFSVDKIKKLHDSGQLDGLEVFFRRKHKRAKIGASLIVHDQKKVYKAVAAEISAGGCGVVLNCNDVEIGKELHLHFKAADHLPPFNAKVEVVSRRKMHGSETRYGFKFLEIATSIQKAITDYAKKVA